MRKFVFTLVLLIVTGFSWANTTKDEVNEILKSKEPPFGVVFEIVESDRDFLELAIPLLQKFVTQLRKKHPKINIAVVSHGSEMFSLQSKYKKKKKDVHKKVKSLVKEQNVPIHVCGTYASWHQVEESAFPDYVDVAPAAPAQIHDYEALGYERIQIEID